MGSRKHTRFQHEPSRSPGGPQMRISISGDEALMQALSVLGSDGADLWKRVVLTQAGKRLKDILRNEYLSGQVVRKISGTYRRSIRVDHKKLPRSVSIGTSELRSGPFEFGWAAKNIRARPHFQPALVKLEKELPEIMFENLGRMMDEKKREAASSSAGARSGVRVPGLVRV